MFIISNSYAAKCMLNYINYLTMNFVNMKITKMIKITLSKEVILLQRSY